MIIRIRLRKRELEVMDYIAANMDNDILMQFPREIREVIKGMWGLMFKEVAESALMNEWSVEESIAYTNWQAKVETINILLLQCERAMRRLPSNLSNIMMLGTEDAPPLQSPIHSFAKSLLRADVDDYEDSVSLAVATATVEYFIGVIRLPTAVELIDKLVYLGGGSVEPPLSWHLKDRCLTFKVWSKEHGSNHRRGSRNVC